MVNPDHRITLLTPAGDNELTGFNRLDGSVWNPHSRTRLFTQEDSNVGGVIEMSADWDSSNSRAAGLRTLYGSMGIGGFEGIHPDDRGNVFIVEDAGGVSVSVDPNDVNGTKKARLPNSFLYRFVPTNPADLLQGKLQCDNETISLVVLGDADHAAFDNVTFASKDVLLVTEDRGDALHTQLNKLDSIWAFDVSKNPSAPARLVALGRDRLSTGVEDNEPTGLLCSDGDSSVSRLLGGFPTLRPALDPALNRQRRHFGLSARRSAGLSALKGSFWNSSK